MNKTLIAAATLQRAASGSGPARAGRAATATPMRPHFPSRALGLGLVATVFGLPFLYGLGKALQGRLFVGRYAYFGADPSVANLTAWVVVSALGSLWLGISLHVGLLPRMAERTRNAVAGGLILFGVMLLFFGVRLLGLRWTA